MGMKKEPEHLAWQLVEDLEKLIAGPFNNKILGDFFLCSKEFLPYFGENGPLLDIVTTMLKKTAEGPEISKHEIDIFIIRVNSLAKGLANRKTRGKNWPRNE